VSGASSTRPEKLDPSKPATGLVDKLQGHRRTLFLVLCVIGAVAILSSTMSKSPALPLLAKSLNADEASIGLIAAISPIPGILVSAFAGAYSDKYGRKPLLIVSCLIFATAPFLYLLVRDPGQVWMLIPIRFYHGFATAIFGPVALAYVAELNPKKKGERMGMYSSATIVGRSIAPFLGGALIGIASLGFAGVYMACAIAGIIALVLLMAGFRNLPEESVLTERKIEAGPRESVWRSLAAVCRNRTIMTTSSIEAIQYFAYGSVETFLPIYALSIGLQAYQIGIMLGVQLVSLLLAKPLMGSVSDRIGRKPVIILGLLLCAISILLIPFTVDFIILCALSMVFGIGVAVTTSSTSALVSDVARKEHGGSAIGVLSSIMDVGNSAGPLVCGILIGLYAYQWSFGVEALLLVFGAIMFYALVTDNG